MFANTLTWYSPATSNLKISSRLDGMKAVRLINETTSILRTSILYWYVFNISVQELAFSCSGDGSYINHLP